MDNTTQNDIPQEQFQEPPLTPSEPVQQPIVEQPIQEPTIETVAPVETTQTLVEPTTTPNPIDTISTKIISKKPLILKIFVGFLVVAVLGTAGLTVYNIMKMNKKPVIKVEIMPPEKVALKFFNEYIDFKGNPLTTGAYKNNTSLTTGFIAKVDKLLEEPKRLLLDPIICGENRPLKVEMGQPVVQDTKATLDVMEEFETTQTMKVAMTLENQLWKIEDVICPRAVQRELTPQIKIKLYFNNSKQEPAENNQCGLVFPIEREVEIFKEPLTASVELLMAGPNATEKEQGFTSMLSETTKDVLNSVKIVGKTAYVDFKDVRKLLTTASTSCGSKNLEAQIKETIKNYRDIDKVIFAIDGKTKDFYDWMQIGCNEFNGNCDDTEFNKVETSVSTVTK